MSVRRIMGAETEFGVLAPGRPQANSTVLSTRAVTAYAALVARELGARGDGAVDFDYSSETPLRDARGFEMDRAQAHPTQLTDSAPVLTSEEIAAEALTEAGMWGEHTAQVVMNTVLPNGARLYVDHSHPEYSSPEVMTPREAALYDLAGDRVGAAVVAALQATAEASDLQPVHLYKNNTDGKSSSYGAHENYTVPRDIDDDALTAALLPFFASRQVICGAGRVGIGPSSEVAGFQLSQRADFFERMVGLETTVRRPMVNTRDEPHADDLKYRRLHVIIGDANLAHWSQVLKFGTTSLVLRLVEQGRQPRIELNEPVVALHTISHDPTLQVTVGQRDGAPLTGLQIQRRYLEAAEAMETAGGATPDEDTAEILSMWREALDTLETDPMAMADRLDWVAKLQLLEGYRERGGLSWDDAKLAMIDVQYHDIRPEKGLSRKLEAAGRLRWLFDEEQIAAAMWTPPADTRADFRGRVVARFPDQVVAAGWDTVALELPGLRRGARIAMPEPAELTRRQTEHWWAAQDVEAFVERIRQDRPDLVEISARIG
ncbi:depupylase/deamidase Dop [Kocuria palustris]|uniref:depupylase/deamidase Dop n=1 Tax=Kocuria palustris TaxID=71999 RepID=UPI0011A9230F|nr:depupylase/deamidase Dop [Kocuria palustris]